MVHAKIHNAELAGRRDGATPPSRRRSARRDRPGRGALLGALLLACGGAPPTETGAGTTDPASTGTPGTTAPTGTTDASPTGACTPTTCDAAGKTCGTVPDGCGDELDCGACVDPETCGGGGVDNVCGRPCVAVRAIFFDLGDTLVESGAGGKFVARPGATDTIAGLKGLGMRVGVVTNTPEGFTMQDLEDLLEDPALLDAFEVVLLSSLADAPPKPAPEIFVEAHGLLSAAPPIEQVAFVSENLDEVADQAEAPTQGARAAGMVGIHLSDAPPSPRADYTFAPDQLGMIAATAEAEWLRCAGP